MEARRKAKSMNQSVPMPVVNPHAAGIDLGSKSHFTCVAQDNVREFGVFTDDLHAIARHLLECKIRTVAMESTGFYWKPLFLLLQDYGFEVILVNARHLKNVKGHKTDVVDAKWLQLLHSIGLLSNSFQPDSFTEELRVLTRHRKSLIEDASRYIAKMNKVLVLMNIQLHVVLRDIAGESGLRVVDAILQGERDAKVLAGLVSPRVKASREDIEKALVGDFRSEHLFELGHCLQLYRYYWEKIRETDRQIEERLQQKVPQLPKDSYKTPKGKRYQKNDPNFDVGRYAYLLSGGVDLLQINGVGSATLLTLLSETGLDLSRFRSGKSFASWLGFAPDRKITGGRVISSHTRRKTNPLAKAIRDAANAVGNSRCRLGDFFRQLAYRKGRMVAIIATARKIAVIIYKMLTEGKPFCYEFTHEESQHARGIRLKRIVNTLKRYGISVSDLDAAMA